MYKSLARAERILCVKESVGWQRDLEPKLKLMITNATGGEKDGKYYPGKAFRKDTTNEQIHQAIGYASAVMDIYNSIENVDKYIEGIKAAIAKKEGV